MADEATATMVTPSLTQTPSLTNGESNNAAGGICNGIVTNGVIESKGNDHKHKHKDKVHEKHRDKDKHKNLHKDKSHDKDRHSSHHRSSSHHKDKDKHRSDKDKQKSDKDKHRSDKDKQKSDKDKHRSDKHRSDKDKHHSDKDKHRSDKDKLDKEKRKSTDLKKSDSNKHEHNSSHKKDVVEHKKIKEEPKSVKQEMIEGSDNDFKENKINLSVEQELISSVIDVKEELIDEDDIPLSSSKKRMKIEDDEDFSPKKVKVEKKDKKRKKNDDEEDFKPDKKKVKNKTAQKSKDSTPSSPTKKGKKVKEEEHVWKWWEEEKKDDGSKWKFLEHCGPVIAEDYEPLPKEVKFYYNGKHMTLSQDAEEVAGFYARMLDHDYTTKEVFNTNFFKDWRKMMTSAEKEAIVSLKKCDFKKMHAYFTQKNEERKNRSKEEKKELKEKNEQQVAEYGWCTIDGHRQRIANFKIEPPGLFRGRGEHPKQGMLKKRTMPEEVIINCSKDSVVPKPPHGHKWKEVRHDNTVTWLASWNENVQGQTKYVMLNAASKLKGEKDWQKYEMARRLHKVVDRIREQYNADLRSKEMRIRQRAVALYFIDKLALRAGNEKDEDQADTVGCCSLRVEHISCHERKNGKDYVVVFDFPGKDSIRYYNEVPVEKRVFKNVQLFIENKQGSDDLFDRLNTQIMNKHLNELMEGLTAKVFRTYNASRTLQEQLDSLTEGEDSIPAKLLSYNRANRAVAILCNHQRAVPKTFDQSMNNMKAKIDDKKAQLEEAEKELKALKKAAKGGGAAHKAAVDKKKKAVERLQDQLAKLEMTATDKEENKQIALGTSKLNYLDPRITVAWCLRNEIPVEKVYNKTQRAKFQWAIDMAGPDYNFMGEPMNLTRNNDEEEEDE